MRFIDRLWDLKAAIATVVESEPVGWKKETLFRVPVVNGRPRPDLRNRKRGQIGRVLSRESLVTGDTSTPRIEFTGLRITRRVFTR